MSCIFRYCTESEHRIYVFTTLIIWHCLSYFVMVPLKATYLHCLKQWIHFWTSAQFIIEMNLLFDWLLIKSIQRILKLYMETSSQSNKLLQNMDCVTKPSSSTVTYLNKINIYTPCIYSFIHNKALCFSYLCCPCAFLVNIVKQSLELNWIGGFPRLFGKGVSQISAHCNQKVKSLKNTTFSYIVLFHVPRKGHIRTIL